MRRPRLRQLEQKEVEAWQKKFLNIALGSEPTSLVSQMLGVHRLGQNKLDDRQQRQMWSLAKAHAVSMSNLEGSHRVERWKVHACTTRRARGTQHMRRWGGSSLLNSR